MKKLDNIIKATLIPCLLLLFLNAAAFAQNSEKGPEADFAVSRIGIIDLERILREAEATERVRILLDEKSREFQQEFAEKEVQLLEREKQLKARQGIIADSEYQDEVRIFQADVTAIQKEIQLRRQSLDKAFQQTQDKIRAVATNIIRERAAEIKLDMVFNDDQLIVFRNVFNFTNDVLSRLNAQTKDVRLEISDTPKTQGE